MIDKILYRQVKVSQDKTVHELVFIFDTRSPFTLSSDSLRGVLELYDWFMVPLNMSHKFVSLRDYQAAVAASQEDTAIIDIELIKKAS
jgi:hypothetical protein